MFKSESQPSIIKIVIEESNLTYLVVYTMDD